MLIYMMIYAAVFFSMYTVSYVLRAKVQREILDFLVEGCYANGKA